MNIQTLIENYQPTETAVELVKKANIALLAGISGAGKDTIKKRLLQDVTFSDIISHTTRPPRRNNNRPEIDGVDYHFIDLEQAEQMVKNREFIEAKFVHGTVYGTSVAELQRIYEAGQSAITDIDVQGVAEYEALAPDNISIFLVPPDCQTWLERLKTRYVNDKEFQSEWPKRRDSAVRELKHVLEVPYYHVVINDDLDRAVRVCREIINRGDLFNQKDDEARLAARNLLNDIIKL